MKPSIYYSLLIILLLSACKENPPYDPDADKKPYTFTISGQLVHDCDSMEGAKRTLSFYKSVLPNAQLRVPNIETDDDGRFEFTFRDTLASPAEDSMLGVYRPYYLRSEEDAVVFIFQGPGNYENISLVIGDSVEMDVTLDMGNRRVGATESLNCFFARYLPFDWQGELMHKGFTINGPISQDTTISYPKSAWNIVELGYDGNPFYQIYWTPKKGDTLLVEDNSWAMSSKVSCVMRRDAVLIDWRE